MLSNGIVARESRRSCIKYSKAGFLPQIGYLSPNSIMVEHVLGKDEAQVRFLLGAPGITKHPERDVFAMVALALD